MRNHTIHECATLCLILWFASAAVQAQGVVDNDDGSPAYVESGPWSTSGATGYNGGTYRFSSVGNGATATWTGNLPQTRDYEVFVWYVPGSNRATSARYDIHAADGLHTVYVNQQGGGFTWDSLGTFPFNAGNNSVVLNSGGSSGGSVVIADAVRFGDDSGPPIDPPTPVEVAPGVYHSVWELPTPQVNHVLEFDLADPKYTIEMGFAQGKRNYTAKQPVSQIVTYYDEPEHEVVGAINASFFGSGIDILGMLGSGGNLIGTDPGVPGLEQTYMLQQSGEGWAISGLPAANMVVKFANGAQVQIDQLNDTCDSSVINLYTPDWGPSTKSTTLGTEIIVESVNMPLRPNKWNVGTITAVQTVVFSLDNDIPTNGFVLSACGGADNLINPHAVVGEQISVRFDMNPLDLANLKTLVTGNVWIVKDGVPFHTGDAARHPRTVIAWSGTRHWFVTFDGRQPGYAVGASTAEQADFLINALGVENAINLDGGGSTTMVINDAVVNCPSDGASSPCSGSERADPNALMLIRRTAKSTLPLTDDFVSAGRDLPWDDKFSLNAVEAFAPAAPGGDGFALKVLDPVGGFETVSTGSPGDANYSVEAWVYCNYQPSLAADGYERVGIFARDDGNGIFEATSIGGGNCYALTFDSNDGRIRAAVAQDGVLTDFLAGAPLYEPSTGWRLMRITCAGDLIRYFFDGVEIASVGDSTHADGRCGIGYHEYFATNSNAQGAHADGFAMRGLYFDPDGDGDLDLVDYAAFIACINGPETEYPPGDICPYFDSDGDQDVDLADFSAVQEMFTGAL